MQPFIFSRGGEAGRIFDVGFGELLLEGEVGKVTDSPSKVPLVPPAAGAGLPPKYQSPTSSS